EREERSVNLYSWWREGERATSVKSTLHLPRPILCAYKSTKQKDNVRAGNRRMGGEWWFTFDTKYAQEHPLDVAAYQHKLRQIKTKYAGTVVRVSNGAHQAAVEGEAGKELEEEEEEEEREQWFEENPEDNVFAQFTYKCRRHSHWGPSGHKPCWFLLWDPTPSPHRSTPKNHVHARCAGYHFKQRSAAIQQELQRAFPRYFELFWGDGMSGHNCEVS
ncbi:hypothetical protein GOP47_0020221, partial [Adiantum capillus-veneris]